MRALNLVLLLLFPVAWFAPMLRVNALPILGPLWGETEVSVVSGLQSLWRADPALALLVTFLAVFAPYAKVIGVGLVQFGLAAPKVMGVLVFLGKLAMADVFLIAIYIVLAKEAGVGAVETAWGLWLFTLCVITSLFVSWHVGRAKDVPHHRASF